VQQRLALTVSQFPGCKLLSLRPTLAVGYAFAIGNRQVDPRAQVRNLCLRAADVARSMLNGGIEQYLRGRLEQIIVERRITNMFQPIVDLRTREVHAYEALARGPSGTELQTPDALLELAERLGMIAELDCVLFGCGLEHAADLPGSDPIFMNVLPSTLYDPVLRPDMLLAELERLRINPRRLVLEISERYVVKNSDSLVAKMRDLRRSGVRFAIDDAGVGYSGLGRVAALEPEFLKIDRSLVDHVDEHSVQRSVLSALSKMASDIKRHGHRRGHRARRRAHLRVRSRLPPRPGLLVRSPRRDDHRAATAQVISRSGQRSAPTHARLPSALVKPVEVDASVIAGQRDAASLWAARRQRLAPIAQARMTRGKRRREVAVNWRHVPVVAEHLRLVAQHHVALVPPPHGADAGADVPVVVGERLGRRHLEAFDQVLVRDVGVFVADVVGQAFA